MSNESGVYHIIKIVSYWIFIYVGKVFDEMLEWTFLQVQCFINLANHKLYVMDETWFIER